MYVRKVHTEFCGSLSMIAHILKFDKSTKWTVAFIVKEVALNDHLGVYGKKRQQQDEFSYLFLVSYF